jgi:hypothetical protein
MPADGQERQEIDHAACRQMDRRGKQEMDHAAGQEMDSKADSWLLFLDRLVLME